MPVDRTASSNPAFRQSYWGNSMYPYVKSYGLYKSFIASHDNFPYGPLPAPTQAVSNYDLNIYLNGWNATASPSPSKTVAFWNGYFAEDFPGFGVETPLFVTKDQGYNVQNYGTLYTFKNSGASCVSNIGGFGYDPFYNKTTAKMDQLGNGANLSYVDGHAKFVHFGSGDFPYLIDSTTHGWSAWWVDRH